MKNKYSTLQNYFHNHMQFFSTLSFIGFSSIIFSSNAAAFFTILAISRRWVVNQILGLSPKIIDVLTQSFYSFPQFN